MLKLLRFTSKLTLLTLEALEIQLQNTASHSEHGLNQDDVTTYVTTKFWKPMFSHLRKKSTYNDVWRHFLYIHWLLTCNGLSGGRTSLAKVEKHYCEIKTNIWMTIKCALNNFKTFDPYTRKNNAFKLSILEKSVQIFLSDILIWFWKRILVLYPLDTHQSFQKTVKGRKGVMGRKSVTGRNNATGRKNVMINKTVDYVCFTHLL